MHEDPRNPADICRRAILVWGAQARRSWLLWVALVVVVSTRAHAGEPVAAAPACTTIEVAVHGDPLGSAAAPRDTSVAGTLIRRDKLVGPGLQTQDVLRAQPGVAVTESGGYGAPSTVSIRGATSADTPIYLGGVRLNDDVGGTADLSLVPLWLLDHVEVYRGHAPVDADRMAPGGAIFFEPRLPKKTMGGVGYSGGSLGVSKTWAYVGGKGQGISGLGGVSVDRALNHYAFLNDRGMLLYNPQGSTVDYRRNADERTVEGWGLARAELGQGAVLDVLANGVVREHGEPRLALVQSRVARGEYARSLVSANLRVPLDAEYRYLVYARSSVLVGRSEYDDPLYELNLRTPHLEITGTRWEQTFGAKLEPSDSLSLHPLVNLAREGIHREPDNIPLGAAHREFARVALGAKQRLLEWLAVNGIASGECHHSGSHEHAYCDTLEPTGRVGLEIGQGHYSVLANWARYIRVPTLGEMYGISGSLHGNVSLRPETSQTIDLGVRAQGARGLLLHGAYLDAFVFARWADELIAYQRAGEGFMLPYNVGRARVLGLEAAAGIRLTSIVRTEVAATVLDPRDTTSGRTTANDVLPFRARLVLVPSVRADWKALGAGHQTVSAMGAVVRAVYQSSRYADPAGLIVIGEHTTVDLEAYVTLFDGVLALRGRIVDLFHSQRTDIIGYPLPGRCGYFGLEATW